VYAGAFDEIPARLNADHFAPVSLPVLRLLSLLAAIALAAAGALPAHAAERLRPARVESVPPPSGNLLFIGAHPDDEVLVAPLLAESCRDGRRCVLVALTRGERGVCLLPGGCGDLAAVRIAEFGRSADLLGAVPLWFELPDGSAGDPAAVRAVWESHYGSADALVQMLADLIRNESPHSVITFDPRHGSTCHPDHRAAGRLVADALLRLGPDAPEAYFVETRVHLSADGEEVRLEPAILPVRGFFEVPAEDWWSFLVASMRAHASQFAEETISALETLPESERRVYLLSVRAFDPADAGDAIASTACEPAAPTGLPDLAR
jgi:LmbE family N-acetylglucosaminyl deacetylase